MHDDGGRRVPVAQLVGLANARLLIRQGAYSDAVLQQVEHAQRLAREGLEETTLESVRALAETAGARVTIIGQPRELEPEVGLAVERTVQESLTNVRKHAPGAPVTVSLSYLPDRFEVEVCDWDSSGDGVALAGNGSGYGLAGMRERAELLGGELTAGLLDDGKGYRVWLASRPRLCIPSSSRHWRVRAF